MKPTKTLKKLSALVLVCLLVIVACSKDDGDGGGSGKPLTEYEFAGIFTGTLSKNGQTTQLEGYVTIEDDGETKLNLLTGSMSGTSVKVGDSYNITVDEASGAFQGVENITGSIDVNTRTIYLSGTNADGTPVTVGGNAQNPNIMNDGGWDALTKSGVTFTHDEVCLASVTINGVTLSGLDRYYQQESRCSDYYFGHHQLRFNLEDKVSQTFCTDITLLMLNGQYETFTQCSVIQFILEENTEYDYTVVWMDGTTDSGTVTTPDGGFVTPICLEKDGPDCEGDGGLSGENGNPRFNLQFTNSGNVDLDLYVQTPGGQIINYNNTSAQGGTLDVDCACGDNCNQENVFWENGPSGTYTFWVDYFGDCDSGSTSSNFTIKVLNNNNVVMTKSGTLSSGESTHWTYNHN